MKEGHRERKGGERVGKVGGRREDKRREVIGRADEAPGRRWKRNFGKERKKK